MGYGFIAIGTSDRVARKNRLAFVVGTLGRALVTPEELPQGTLAGGASGVDEIVAGLAKTARNGEADAVAVLATGATKALGGISPYDTCPGRLHSRRIAARPVFSK